MKHCKPTFSLILTAALGFTTNCSDRTFDEHSTEPSATTEAVVDARRQNAIFILTRRLYWYHDNDLLETANPGSTDKEVVTINNKRFAFKTRKELRADLNRVLDSLRRTGPLVLGNHAAGTDTMPYREPFMRRNK